MNSEGGRKVRGRKEERKENMERQTKKIERLSKKKTGEKVR